MRKRQNPGKWAGAAAVAALCLVLPAQKTFFAPAPARQDVVKLDPAKLAAPEESNQSPITPAQEKKLAAMGYDLAGVREALHYYEEGEILSGDAALQSSDPMVRAAIEWTVLRQHAGDAGLDRIAAFLRAHSDWPLGALRKTAEDMAASELTRPEKARAYFAEFPPATVGGQIALAALLQAEPARAEEGVRIARNLWRGVDLSGGQEKKLQKLFGASLSSADHLYRAERLMMREQAAGAARAALLAGKDAQALFRAEADLANGAAADKVLARVPAAMKDAPGLLFARIHAARHADKIDEAAKLMLAAPRAAEDIAPDEWWTERRLLARKLLDAKDADRAYKICAGHDASTNEARIEAEFHAGWIALRFLNDPQRAAPHFETMAALAHTPHSAARAAYWRGRAEEAHGGELQETRAREFYARAAAESETFYGQLARSRLGRDAVALRLPPAAAEGEDRRESVRAAELLFSLGAKEAARSLALESAQTLPSDQMAALSQIISAQGDARTALLAGKSAFHRGIAIDELAWPVNGLPSFVALANSAAQSVVLAIARQESAFDATAHSGAGAQGLMQMIPGTARNAAKHAGLAFDEARLKSDPAFNAQLGAFHLGELLGEYRGSHVLAFAAYNAGGGNVHDWIVAYGDPRDPNVDPIDWIERIPFTETRNYVQRVVENLHVYRARLGDAAPDLFKADLRQKVAAKE